MHKTKQESSLWRQLSPYLKSFHLFFLVAILFSIVSSIITVIGPDKLKEITDTITKGMGGAIDIDKITSIALTLAILYGVGALVSYSSSFIISTMIQRFAERLRNAIAEKINRVPLQYFDSHEQGDTLSRVTNDVDLMTQSFNQSLVQMVSSIVLLIGSIFMMFKTDWHLAVTAIVSVFAGFALSSIIMVKSQPLFKQQQDNLAKVSGYVEEIYSGHNVVISYNGRHQAKDHFDAINQDLYHSMWKSQFFSGIMMPLMQFVGNFGYVMVCIVGAVLTINGDITIGTIVAFMTYVRIFTQPIGQMAQGITQLQSASAAMGRVFEFLDEEEMQDESKFTKKLYKEKVKGDIEFENVVFQYDNNPKPTIQNFSAKAKAGQKIAIVGPTGAGKTTLVNLLMKFYDINSGDIKIDGVSTKELTRENIHDLFTMVLQDTWLFDGTIKENIVYNTENVTDEQVKEVCKVVGLDHFIKTLPKGLDTELSDNDEISAGQKQLLTIARGMLNKTPFLILDEATSNVDTRTEELVQKAMDKLTEGKTSFIIAHRLSTIKNADLILVVDNGNIIEQGNHEELMEKHGFYADLYNSQFEL